MALPSGPRTRPSPEIDLEDQAGGVRRTPGICTVNLTLRELRSRYKKSVLGWTWSLLNPLATVVVYSIVFAFFLKIEPPDRAIRAGCTTSPSFLLCGLLPWNYLVERR